MTSSFGVQGSGPLVGGAPAPEHYRRIAETAEAAGFDSLWAGDHVAFHHPLLDVTVALGDLCGRDRARHARCGRAAPAAAGTRTRRARVRLARLSLRRSSDPRRRASAASSQKDFEAVGVPIRERGARTDESMRALRELFSGGRRASTGASSRSRRSRSRRHRPSRAGRRSGSAAARRQRSAAPGSSATAGCRSGSRPSATPRASISCAGCRRRSRRRGRAARARRRHDRGSPALPLAPVRDRVLDARDRALLRRRLAGAVRRADSRVRRRPVRSTSSSIRRSRPPVCTSRSSFWRRWPTLPLADIRVIAFEQFGAGPWGTLQLADLGAEVIKIEDPVSRGDVGRYVPPFAEGEDSLFFEAFNRNKKSVSLDLRRVEARAVLEDLVRNSDVVYSNLRGDQPRRLGLTYEQLKQVNAQIVCCSLSGFGMTGPRAGRGRLRLHDARACGLDVADRRPRRPADEERSLARRPVRRLRLGDRGARRRVARATRRRRLRLRRVALRDRPARALLRRHVGGVARLRAAPAAQLGAPVDRAVPELRHRRRLDRRRVPEAEVLGIAVRRARTVRSSRPTSASPTSRRATATATSCSRFSTPPSPNGRPPTGSRCSPRPGCRARR